jgi:hypothetical protein
MTGRRVLLVVVGVLVLLALTTTVAWAANGEPTDEGAEPTTSDALLIALAPIVTIATAVERMLEMFWERWEKVGAWPNKKGVMDFDSPSYISKKKAGSHWLGTVLAVIAIGLTNARFFRMLGFDVLFSNPNMQLFSLDVGGIFDAFTIGTLIDWLLTAIIIGWGGTELTHSIIEGLVKGRNLWKEMREVEAGRKSILDAKFFNDYIAPELEKRGVSVAKLRGVMQGLESAGISPDEVISSITIEQIGGLLGKLESNPKTAAAGHALRDLLDDVPQQQAMEIPNVLALLTPEQRRRFLGA